MSARTLRLVTVLVIAAGTVAAAPPKARAPQPTPTAAPPIRPPAVAKFAAPCSIESPGLRLFKPVSESDEPDPKVLLTKEMKQGTKLDLVDQGGLLGRTVPIQARLKLKPEGTAVPNHTVHFWVDGQYHGNAQTDAMGTALVTYMPTALGTRTVRARYFGSDVCAGSKDENTLEISKARSAVKITRPSDGIASVPFGHQVTIEGQVTCTSTGQPRYLSRPALLVSVDGQPSGTSPSWFNFTFGWTYTTPEGSIGDHRVEVRFPGDDVCAAAGAALTLKVTPPLKKARLRWWSVEGQVGETKTARAELTYVNPWNPADPTPEPVPGVQISFERERGVEWPMPHVPQKWLGNAVTNSLGVATITFTIDDQPMAYTLRAIANNVAGTLIVENDVGIYYPTLTVHPKP